jgi:type IV pilus assembly protein PilM
MISLSKMIFGINENSIEIAEVSMVLNKINVKRLETFTPVQTGSIANIQYNKEENIIKIHELLKDNGFKQKSVNIVLDFDSIITRLITIPAMKKQELNKYINSNLDKYFTVNNNDFYFDYKIVESLDEGKKLFVVLLVALPKEKMRDVLAFINACQLKLRVIDIFPNCLGRVFDNNKSMAIIDSNIDKYSITILDHGKIFLHSAYFTELNIDDESNDGLENITYFINFFASRHFGRKLDSLNVLGVFEKDKDVKSRLSASLDIKIYDPLKDIKYKIVTPKNLEASSCMEFVGSVIKSKDIYNKNIDFKSLFVKKKERKNVMFVRLVFSFSLITFLWLALGTIYINYKLVKYNTITLDKQLAAKTDIQNKINEIDNEKTQIEVRKKLLMDIKSDAFDYLNILNSIKNGLPKSVKVSAIDISKDKVKISLNISKNTLEIAKSIIAINNIGIFENIDITDVKLDDSIETISFELKIKSTNKGGRINE